MKQETFLNVNQVENFYFYWFLLLLKCLIAGIGTKYVLNIYTRIIFINGALINSCINFKSWFVPILCILFAISTFTAHKFRINDVYLLTIFWAVFCVRTECEFYLDIYTILCFLSLIFQIYGKKYEKAIAFIAIMAFLNWMVDNEDIIKANRLYWIILSYPSFFLVMMPPKEDVWELEIKKRLSYLCVNLLMFLILLYRCYKYALGKDIEDTLNLLYKIFYAEWSDESAYDKGSFLEFDRSSIPLLLYRKC